MDSSSLTKVPEGFQAIHGADSRKRELLEQRMGLGPSTSPTANDNNIFKSMRVERIDSEQGTSDSEQDHAFPSHANVDETKIKKKRKHFTPEEDTKILEGHRQFGTEWPEIVKWGNLDRTPAQVKDRFRRLKKNEEQQPPKRRKIEEDENRDENSGPSLVSFEKERTKELDDRKEMLDKKERELAKREEYLQIWEEKKRQDGKVESTKAEQTQKILADLVRQKAEQEKQMCRLKLLQECHRLGQVLFERHSTSYIEVWQDGQAFKDLSRRHARILRTREQLEKERKELTKQIKKKSEVPGADLEDLLQREEIVKIRLLNIKKEEGEVNFEKEKLIFEKNVHIRELKRVHDEDQSRFNNQVVLKQRYVLMNLLGKGGFSEVYKAFDLLELREVACKIHQLNTLWTDRKKENYIRHACREYNIHKSVVHPKIVRLFDVFEIDDNSFCTVLEYCNGPDLDLYLKTQQNLTEREAKSIITQIFKGLEYLSQQKRPIIHYDLKPGNILFHDGEVKITDFGLSKIMEEDQSVLELTSQGAGTYWYLPPECFEVGKEPPKISSKVDVWATGVIFYQMLFGKKPFGNNLSQQKILVDNIITTSVLEFPTKPVISKEGKEFIIRCLERNQSRRPDVNTCCADPYLKLSTPPKRDVKKSGSPPKISEQ